mmetsp:Transcript_10120/g.17768  ORF Transcript_10120/g.17768 Transcript_10120/m.17768 type:complete len:83 (-) Transcript_10120:840-1088(-)
MVGQTHFIHEQIFWGIDDNDENFTLCIFITIVLPRYYTKAIEGKVQSALYIFGFLAGLSLSSSLSFPVKEVMTEEFISDMEL